MAAENYPLAIYRLQVFFWGGSANHIQSMSLGPVFARTLLLGICLACGSGRLLACWWPATTGDGVALSSSLGPLDLVSLVQPLKGFRGDSMGLRLQALCLGRSPWELLLAHESPTSARSHAIYSQKLFLQMGQTHEQTNSGITMRSLCLILAC